MGSNSCINCPSGTYNPYSGTSASSNCVACPVGTFCGNGASVWSSCSAGQYQPNAKSSACISCPVGTYNTYTGSASLSSYINCAAGTYNLNTGSVTCVGCAAGLYSASTASFNLQSLSSRSVRYKYGSKFCFKMRSLSGWYLQHWWLTFMQSVPSWNLLSFW